jgi:hypothetical protein
MERVQAHASPAGIRRSKTRSARWVAALLKRGLMYESVILEACESEEQLDDVECWWIAYGRASGWPLTNLSAGGKSPRGIRQSAETRARRSRTMTGRQFTPVHRAAISRAAKARYQDPEQRRIAGERLALWRNRPEVVERCREASRAYARQPGVMEAFKARMEKARNDPELMARVRAGRRERMLGDRHPGKRPETRLKMSIAAKAREARKREMRDRAAV